MAEEVNAAKVAPSPKSVQAASNNGTGGSHQQLKEEVDPLIRSPKDATPALRADNPTIYQADVVEGDTTTTEKPAEGGTAPEAAASPAAPAADAAAAPAEGQAAPASPAAADAPASPAAANSPTAEAAAPAEGAAAKSPEEGTAAAPGTADTTLAPGAETSAAPAGAAGVTTTVGPATGSPTTKDPYAIDIPLDKKINKRTQRKLWEEIEKRKPLVPKHVAQHIQKYAKPPFETWGCKFRGKGSCSGCK